MIFIAHKKNFKSFLNDSKSKDHIGIYFTNERKNQ